jgi:hypothetical protein
VTQTLADRPHTEVASFAFACLDSFPHCGHCAVCNRWVYDVEASSHDIVSGLCYARRNCRGKIPV